RSAWTSRYVNSCLLPNARGSLLPTNLRTLSSYLSSCVPLGLIGPFFSLTRPYMVSFRLGGTHFSYSVSQFGVACSFYTDDEIGPPEYTDSIVAFLEAVDPRAVWTYLTTATPPYEPTISKNTFLQSPAL